MSLPGSARAVIGADSQSEPSRNWLRLPHYDTGIRYQDEPGSVSGVAGLAISAARPDMPPQRRPIPYACDTPFRTIQSNKYQVDLIPAGSSFADQVHSAAAGKSRLDRKTQLAIEIIRSSFQPSLPAAMAAADGFNGFSCAIVSASRSRPRPSNSNHRVSVDFPEPFGPAITVRVGTLP